jgi:hypothetical protein
MNPPHDGLAAAANHPVGRLAGSRAAAEELFSACYPRPAGSRGGSISWLSTGLRGTRAAYSDAYNRSARWRAV